MEYIWVFKGSCGEPPQVVGGSYIGGDMWIGDVLELRCDDGYDLINGEDNTITCQSDGEWTSSNASCKREFRLPPSHGLTNAIVWQMFQHLPVENLAQWRISTIAWCQIVAMIWVMGRVPFMMWEKLKCNLNTTQTLEFKISNIIVNAIPMQYP